MSDLERRIVNIRGENRYCVIGPDGAVDFHFSELNKHDPIAGLECHYRRCPTYMRDRSPITDKCWLIGGRCWGDGTSLYATEWLLPLFREGTVEEFWPILEREYRKRFDPREIAFIEPEAAR